MKTIMSVVLNFVLYGLLLFFSWTVVGRTIGFYLVWIIGTITLLINTFKLSEDYMRKD